jgi:hypothetical protein
MKRVTAGRRLAVALACLAIVGLLLGVSQPAGAVEAPAPSGGNFLYFPLVEDLRLVYLPLTLNQVYVPVNLVNGSFEADTLINLNDQPPCHYFGFTDQPKGNQHPSGWTFYSPAAGQPLPFPTKMQMGTVVSATSGGPGEYVHKCWWQLPTNERLGQPQGLILDGNWTYKAFNSGSPQALVLSQVLTGTPGLRIEVTGYILGETPDKPSPPNTKLEDDHFIGSVQLGSVTDTRFYATMIQHNDVSGNTRHWNKYDLTATVPDSGQLLLTVIMQQNWSGETDFFIDNFSAIELFSN